MDMLLDRAAEKPRREPRYVYNGDSPGTAGPVPGYAMRPNKRTVRRKVSTFNIILLLFAVAVSAVLYIGNFLAVNQLAVDVDRMDVRYQEITNANAALRAELDRKSALERIGAVASERLGLQTPKEQPVWFEVDPKQLEAAIDSQSER